MKKVLATALTVMMALNLAACSGGGGQQETKAAGSDAAETTKGAETGAAAESQASDAEGSDGLVQGTGVTLTVYTNSGSDGRGDWLVERAAKDGFKIQYIEAGGAEIQNRLLAEKNAPIADVVYGLNSIMWESLKAEDILIPYTPVWAGEIPEGLNDPEGYYHAIVKQAILLVYDENQMSPEEAPGDWLDLWTDEAFDGKYEYLVSLSGGTVRNVLAGILTRYADPAGELGISQEGWDQIAQYYQHGVPAEDGVDLYGQISDPNSPVLCGQMWSSGVETRDEQYGTSTKYVVPEVGVPYAVEAISIVNGTKNEEEAQRFLDWFGSAQIQGEWAEEFSTLPANVNAVDKANAFNQEIAQIPAQNIDWGLVAENIDAWVENIELNYMP